MPADESVTTDRARASGRRLRRSGRSLVRLGAVLVAVCLVITLISGWATRSMITHLQDSSAELLDGEARVGLTEGTERTLYVTGGLVAPGELVPTPVDQITCGITGPDGQTVPFDDRSQERIGLDTAAARLQVLGSFQAQRTGDHLIQCRGLGVVVAPEVNPASVLARLGGLTLGSLGAILGLTMLLIGGALLLLIRPEDQDAESVEDDPAAPPPEGAQEWWQEEAEPAAAAADDRGRPEDALEQPAEDDYVELTQDQLAALSDEEIEELVASGALVFEDDEAVDDPPADAGHRPPR